MALFCHVLKLSGGENEWENKKKCYILIFAIYTNLLSVILKNIFNLCQN